MKRTDLERLFTGRIEDNSILCTDSHKSYIQFAQNLGIELQQIKLINIKKEYIIYSILMLSIVNSRSGWIGLMELQLNTSLTICISLNGLKSSIPRKILYRAKIY